MTAIVWHETGTRFYETGVDRGVLYLPEGGGVPWNGLLSVNENVVGKQSAPFYFDGVKYADVIGVGDFAGSIKAYTYPDEFLQFDGIVSLGNGLFVTNQNPKRFNLSYRTKIGNEEDDELGYKIHILYNLTAIASQKNYQSQSNDPNIIEFEWNITAIPEDAPGFQPTAHLIIDSRHMNPILLADIENTLYGTVGTDPELPSVSTLTSFISDWVIIRITDNGNGTWTATGPDDLITMLDSTTFQIIQANAEYLDADTYMISDSTF